MTEALPIAFHNLPPEKFPFTVRAHDSRNNNVVWLQKISGPGAVRIPPLAKQIGAPVIIRITWPDGTVEETS